MRAKQSSAFFRSIKRNVPEGFHFWQNFGAESFGTITIFFKEIHLSLFQGCISLKISLSSKIVLSFGKKLGYIIKIIEGFWKARTTSFSS